MRTTITLGAARASLFFVALSLSACAADGREHEEDGPPYDESSEEVATTQQGLGVQTSPSDGTACTVTAGGSTHTGKSEKNGQWCCTPAGSSPDSNTCYSCSTWSFACSTVSKSIFAVAR